MFKNSDFPSLAPGAVVKLTTSGCWWRQLGLCLAVHNVMMDTDLIDEFVHGAFPFEQNFVEAAEPAGICHISRV